METIFARFILTLDESAISYGEGEVEGRAAPPPLLSHPVPVPVNGATHARSFRNGREIPTGPPSPSPDASLVYILTTR